jgi:hypothetical protein
MLRKILAILLLVILSIAIVGSGLVIGEVIKITVETITILPEKTKDSKLIRIVDREAGVVCYMIQNDTADFYSGLQCMPTNITLLERKGRGLW